MIIFVLYLSMNNVKTNNFDGAKETSAWQECVSP